MSAILALAPVFARKATILGAFSVPTGPLLLDCLACGERAAELAKPCTSCGTVYDETAAQPLTLGSVVPEQPAIAARTLNNDNLGVATPPREPTMQQGADASQPPCGTVYDENAQTIARAA